MRYNVIVIALLTILFACGDSTGPSSSGLTPSTLSIEFTGDSSKVHSYERSLIPENYTETLGGIRISDVSKGSCEVTASWTVCPESSFSSYVLYRSETSGISSDPSSAEVLDEFNDSNINEYVDVDVEWAKRYYYALKTTDSDNNSVWSNEASLTTPGSVPTPSILTLDNVSWENADLIWTMCSDSDFEYYRLYRSEFPNIEDDTSFASRVTTCTSATDTTYIDSDISEEMTYYYALITLNNKGLLSWSNEICVQVPEGIPDSVTSAIGVGNAPYSLCINNSGDYVYAANCLDNSVSVVSTLTNTVVATIDIGSQPYSICSLPSEEYVYTANSDSDNVSVIRTSDNTVVATVSVGDFPTGICSLPSGEYVYVTSRTTGSVYVIRTSDNSIYTIISNVGNEPFDICALPSGEYVYVSNHGFNNDVAVIRTSDNSVIKNIPVQEDPTGICALPSGGYVYVSDRYLGGSVSVIATSTNTVIDTIDVGSQPYGICSLPSGEYVYVVNNNSGSISMIRTSDNQVIATVDVGNSPAEICSNPTGELLYLSDIDDDCVYVIE